MTNDNPIFERYFKNASMLTSKTFDSPLSAIHRKQYIMWSLLADSKPSSQPNATMVERTGDRALHHVLWLKNEGNALRESISYRDGKRGKRQNERIESRVRIYMNHVYKAIARLRTLAK